MDKAEAENVLDTLRQQYGQDSVHYIYCDVCIPDQIEGMFTLAEETFEKVEIFVKCCEQGVDLGRISDIAAIEFAAPASRDNGFCNGVRTGLV